MSVLHLIPVWFVLALTIPIVVAVGGAYRRAKGRRTVTCPDTNQSAVVELDARHAALMHVVGDRVRKIHSCSLWPERSDCSRHCQAWPSR